MDLTKREFDLLDALSGEPRVAFSRERLLERVWGGEWFGVRSGTVAIALRAKRQGPSRSIRECRLSSVFVEVSREVFGERLV